MSCKCDTINIVNDNNVVIVSHADGRDGKSAYQQAVEGGYTGTEQEFNCSLSLLADVAEGKRQIADAINTKGGSANPNSAFTQLAQDIEDIENFPTTGFEYISEIYRPRTLMEAYMSRLNLKSIEDNYIEELSGDSVFSSCNLLESISFTNLVLINGSDVFYSCVRLVSVTLLNLKEINGGRVFGECDALQVVTLPNLVRINGRQAFYACNNLRKLILPSLILPGTQFILASSNLEFLVLGTLSTAFSLGTVLTKLRDITLGTGVNINLNLDGWTATNVIAEGRSGIDELNSNLYNNLLTKLYDHSTDGQTRTLRLGWLAHVSQENIDYANSKGWTLTT